MIFLNRLYVADYSSLANIPLVSGSVLYAPQVLKDKGSFPTKMAIRSMDPKGVLMFGKGKSF